MKCRDLLKILPELIENELDEETSGQAMAHIDGCRSCRTEKVKYEEILQAAAMPWEPVEEPEDMVLVFPDRAQSPVTWPRIAWATAAAVVCIGLISMMHPKPTDHTTPVKVVKKHQTQEPVVVVTGEQAKPDIAEKTIEPKPIRASSGVNTVKAASVNRHYRQNRRVVKRNPAEVSGKPLEVVKEQPKHEIAHNDNQDPDTSSPIPAQPVVVIVSDIPQPSVIETESVDEATGKVSITRIVLNEVGEEITSEITYVPNKTDTNDWRDKL